MLLLRSYLWGAMPEDEQLELGQKPEVSFFPVWPFFLGFCFLFPCGALYLWHNTLSQDDYRHRTSYTLVAGMVSLLYSIGLMFYTMKTDHSTLTANLTANLPDQVFVARQHECNDQ